MQSLCSWNDVKVEDTEKNRKKNNKQNQRQIIAVYGKYHEGNK